MDRARRVESTFAGDISSLPARRPDVVRAESSPSLGYRRAPVLRSGRRYPINIASIIPRPPSPYPVSARSTSPASLGSSNGSNYLSPPAEADGETPPYKPDADDPISLNMYKCRKRKRRAKHGHSNRSATKETTKPTSFPLYGIREPQVGTTDVSTTKGLHRKSKESDSQTSVPLPCKLSRMGYEPWRRSSSSSASPPDTSAVEQSSWLITNNGRKILPRYPLRPALQITTDRPKSSRRKLDKISQALNVRQRRRWSMIEAGALPVPTFSTALAFQRSKGLSGEKHLMNQHSTYHDFPNRPSTDCLSERSLTAGDGGRPSMKSRKLPPGNVDTPATITLRRASGTRAYQRSRNDSGPTLSPAPPLNLTTVKEFQESENLAAPYLSQSIFLIRRECKPVSEQARTSGVNTVKQCVPRRSVVAETVTTYADVHVAPTIVASNVIQQESALPVEQLRRTSAMQIRSRSSVHEIIWKDDYSSSNKSSTGNKTPMRSLHIMRTQSDPVRDGTCRGLGSNPECDTDRKLSLTAESPHVRSPSLGGEFAVEFETGNFRPGHITQKLFEWNWNHKSQQDNTKGCAMLSFEARRTSAAPEGDDGPANLLPPEAPAFLSEFESVETSPPLPDRHPTVDWQALPLTNPKNPRAGPTGTDQATGEVISPSYILYNRNPMVTGRRRSSAPKIGRTYMIEGSRRQSYVRNHPYAPPRVGDDSVAGSAIGSSSRMRRRSINAHQRDSTRKTSGTSSDVTVSIYREPLLKGLGHRRPSKNAERTLSAASCKRPPQN